MLCFFLIREINIVHTYSFLLLCVSIVELLAMSALTESEDLKAFDAPTLANTDRVCFSFVDAETELLTLLVTHGPVAAAVNAISWQNYLGGVIQYHCDGSFDSLNHAVQIVGYDTETSIPHYIIKNSWGPSFGNKGYIYIAIGKNLCGKINE